MCLIDSAGYLVHSWPTTFVSGNTNYVLDNGVLLRQTDLVLDLGDDGGPRFNE